MSQADRLRCKEDAEKIISTTLRDLICDATEVIVQGLIVLDQVSRDHSEVFIPSMNTLFLRLTVKHEFA